MKSTYSVEPFSKQALFKALSNKYCDSEQVARQHRAIYLSSYLTDISAQTIVIEHDYTDGDYLEDFAWSYVRCYRNYDRRCKRIHFFNAKFEEVDFRQSISQSNKESVEKILGKYLGVRGCPSSSYSYCWSYGPSNIPQ